MNKKILLAVLILVAAFQMQAQTAPEPVVKTFRHSIYAGVGPNVFFNNLVIGKDYVNELNYSFSFRLMWEPEHLLSLGIESGYYRLYSVDFGELSEVNIANDAIPIQLVISMKFLRNFYSSFGSGQTILLNKVSNTGEDNYNASTISLGDLNVSLGYKHDWSARFTWSVESKFFYSSKLNDKNIALLFLAGYKF